MVQAAMALAAQSPLQLTAALGVPVTAVTRQPDVFVTVVPPQPEDKSWVYILVGVLGTLVAVLAVGFVLYRRKMQRKKRGDAPHITTAYKQTHRHDDRSGLTRGDDLPDLPEYAAVDSLATIFCNHLVIASQKTHLANTGMRSPA
jgi:hypothetical protein